MKLRLPTFLVRCALSLALAGASCLAAAQTNDSQEVSRLIKAGQLDQAMQKADAALSQRPRDAQMRFLKGLIYTEQHKTQDAINVYTKLTEDFPELPEPYNNLAVLYAQQGQYEKARAALEMAIRTHPSYATAHENLGDVYAKLASEAYGKALQLDASNSAAQTKLSLIRDLIGGDGRQRPGVGGKAPAAAPAKQTAPGTGSKPPAPVAMTTPPPSSPAAPSSAAPSSAAAPASAAAKPAPMQAPAKTLPATAAATGQAAATAANIPGQAAAPAKAASAEAGPQAADQQAIAAVVQDWAQAWSRRDVSAYLAHYAKDFQTPKGMSRTQWETERRKRIEGKQRIDVRVEDIAVTAQGDRATAKFRQFYRGGRIDTRSTKTLVMERSGGKWLIQQERSGA